MFDPNAQYECGPTYPPDSADRILDEAKSLAIIRPERNIEDSFNQLVETLRDWENYVLVVDETNTVQSAHKVEEGIEYLMRQSPDDVDVIQTTHRLSDTQRLTRSLASDWFFFRHTLRPELDLIENEHGSEVMRAVERLGNYQVVHVWLDAGGQQRHSVWHDPRAWYVAIRD